MKTCLKALLFGTTLVASFASPAFSKVITYCISAKTWNESGAATDNLVYLTMKGEKGTSSEFLLQGSKESDQTDEFTVDIKDIGKINTLTINVTGVLADHWSPNFIRIYRNTDCLKKDEVGGWSEFAIQKSLPYGPNDYDATDGGGGAAEITVSATGKKAFSSKEVTIVSFSNNTGKEVQDVNLLSEQWSTVDNVEISNNTTDSVGVGAGITYESPETIVGTFGVQVSTTWNRTIDELKTKSHQTTTSAAFDWRYKAEPHAFTMRRITFKVPYSEQIYEDSQGRKYAIRNLGDKIAPTGGSGDYLTIPQRNDDQSIEPVSLQELENDWFPHLSDNEVSSIKRKYLPKWLSKGYVVDGDVPAQSAAKPPKVAEPVSEVPAVKPPKVAEPEVAVQDEPAPAPTPAPVKKKKKHVAAAAPAGINGANLASVTHSGGKIEKTGDAEWTEFNANGEAGFTFQETGRDEWSVYLDDPSRNVQLQLDVHRKMITYGQGGGEKSDLYPITSMQ
jgi:PLAT/LH2 domain